MCRLNVIGTGSNGNTYLLQCGDEVLVLECGIPFKDVKVALDFDIRGIQGVLATHCHSDHAKYASEYEAAGIPVFKPYEQTNLRQDRQFGGFRVQSFPVVHDVPCVGYLIGHKDIGKMLYVTDSAYIRYLFKDLTVMLLEANWSEKYVKRDEAKYRHVVSGHMSIETCVGTVRANATSKLRNVILCHLSDGSSNAVEFKKAVEAVVPAGCRVDIADKGIEVDLSEIPF